MVDTTVGNRLHVGSLVVAVVIMAIAVMAPALLTSQPQWTIYAAWIWALLGAVVLLTQRWPDVAAWALRGIGPALAVACLAQRAMGRVTWPYNENATASMLLLLLPWWWGKNWMVVAILVAGLVATGSAGALLALAVAVALLIAHSYANDRRPFWAYALIIVGVAIIAGVVISTLQPETTAARLEHWRVAWHLAEQRPWFGFGPGAYPAVSTIPGQNHADSFPLTMIVEIGIVGWAFLFNAIFEIAYKIFDTSGNPARMALLAWLLHNLVDCTLYFPLAAALLAANVALLWRWHGSSTDRVCGSGVGRTVGGMGTILRGSADPE